MELSYRGIRYEYIPQDINVVEGDVGGKYRGSVWRFHRLEAAPAPQPVLHLTYRGVRYVTGTAEQAAAPPVQPSAEPKTLLGSLFAASRRQHQKFDAVAQQHLANIRQTLEHRIQVAKEKGDWELVRLLEMEEKSITV